jgi:hypothetical protein
MLNDIAQKEEVAKAFIAIKPTEARKLNQHRSA